MPNSADEFFTDIRLHDPQGGNVMLLGLAHSTWGGEEWHEMSLDLKE